MFSRRYRTRECQQRVSAIEPLEARWCLASLTFVPNEIQASESDSRSSLYLTDFDGDGDLDVLEKETTHDESRFGWYENKDGKGAFGPKTEVAQIMGDSRVTILGDMDGDHDQDVLATVVDHEESRYGILWYENNDVEATLGPQRIFYESGLVHFTSLDVADIDGDGDSDVLVSTIMGLGNSGGVFWLENVDGKGSFRTSPHAIEENTPDWMWFVRAFDVDADGDPDIVSADNSDVIVWYENTDGKGMFGAKSPIHSGGGSMQSLIAADVDGDGDDDLLLSSRIDLSSTIAWHENTDGTGNFGPPAAIEVTSDFGVSSLIATDLDNDGDVDVLAEFSFGRVAWYENTDGKGDFGPPLEITDDVFGGSVSVGDLDADGDLDFVFGGEDGIIWYEQRLVGDSNDDGIFDSSDLVTVFAGGKYEDGIRRNATFDEGDWNLDGDFDSSDLVLAFQAGHYVATATPVESQIAAAIDGISAHEADAKKSRAFVA